MVWLIIATIVGINFSGFVIHGPDLRFLWVSNGFWFYFGSFFMLAYSLFENSRPIKVKNKPLALLTAYVLGLTTFFCYKMYIAKINPSSHMVQLFNFLLMIALYRHIVGHLTTKSIEKVLVSMRAVAVISLFVCVLQKFNMSQFFTLIYPDNRYINNLVVGFVGNGTHLSGFMASCIPLFLWKHRRVDILAIVLTVVLLLFYTSTTVGQPAISGIVIGWCLIAYHLFRKNKKWLVVFVVLSVAIGGMVLSGMPTTQRDIFFGDSGRAKWWPYYWHLFRISNSQVLGGGLGLIDKLSLKTPYPDLNHLHFEYFQFLIELGFIGLFLILSVIVDFIHHKAYSDTEIVLKGMVYGFLISCFFNWPAHLWLPSAYAVFAYSSLFALKNERMINGIQQTGDSGQRNCGNPPATLADRKFGRRLSQHYFKRNKQSGLGVQEAKP